jgi:hypothetical protein
MATSSTANPEPDGSPQASFARHKQHNLVQGGMAIVLKVALVLLAVAVIDVLNFD